MPPRTLTVEDLWALPRVGAPAPSPDGTRVVVPVTTYSMETDEGTTRLWLIPSGAKGAGVGGAKDPARALTTADASSGQPSWSPDGARLVFVRKPGGAKADGTRKTGPVHVDQPQLYILPLDGGEPERLTDLPLGAADPRWFPDGKRIAFLTSVFADAPTLEQTAKRAKERQEDRVKVCVTEDRIYRYWDRWLTDGKFHHLFILDLETREMVDLIPGSRRWFDLDDPTGQYRIAPDGREIAFSACRTEPPYDPALWGVFTVEVPARIHADSKPGKLAALTDDYPADAIRPVYSPDGRWIVFGMQREYDFYADKVRLVAYERKTRKHSVLTEDWRLSAMNWTFGEDSRVIYFAAEVEGRIGLYTLDLHAAVESPRAAPPREIIRGGSFTAPQVAQGRIFATRSSLREPPEVVACDLGGKGLRAVTAFTRPLMKGILLSEVEEATFKGADDEPVQMFLLYPPGERVGDRARRTAKRWPLVHMMHGGPHATFPDDWHFRWNAQAHAAPGYLVALVNFHGSTGWGQEFTASILGRWGDQPYRDIMAATDYLIERGLVDPARMAATGGSYGGYLASWIASQTDRFACIINHAGVSDFQGQYASDVTQGRRRSLGGEPWENLAGMDRFNPMRYASGFRSPMLVIHGEKDYRVPAAQGIGIYNVYKAMRLPARLVYFPDENHWVLKPQDSRYWYGEVLSWLKRWLGERATR